MAIFLVNVILASCNRGG